MRVVLLWAKNNFVILIAAILCIVSLGALGYIHTKGNEFVASMAKIDPDIKRVGNFLKTEVKIPAEEANGEPRKLTIAINQAAINALKEAYKRMGDEYREIFLYATSLNSKDHRPMIDGLFPNPAGSAPKAYLAKTSYRRAFAAMFERFSPNADYPQLNAKPPLSPDELADIIRRAEDEFRAQHFIAGALDSLTPVQASELHSLKQKRLVDTIRAHAESINLYSDIDAAGKDYPFDLDAWSLDSGLPRPEQLWEGQMGLWIQQDIARAIALTNRVNNPSSNVLNMPVKRLVRMQIVPGYVGMNGASGGINMEGPVPGKLAGGLAATNSQGVPTMPTPGPGKEAAPVNINAQLRNDFTVSPSGRTSNPLYDVVHVWVKLVVDVQRMPEFFDNLSQVNFMTVLKMELRDVDEYQALTKGYAYGPVDCVEISMLVETIWLREWTSRLMPLEIRNQLGVPDPNAPAAVVEEEAPPTNPRNRPKKP